MGNVGGIGAGRREDFTHAELEKLESNESTAHAMNAVRKDAHYTDSDVVIRGDDKTFVEQAHEFKMHLSAVDKVHMGVDACSTGVEVAGTFGWETGELLSVAALPLTSIAFFVHETKKLMDENKHGIELRATATKDEMHVMLVGVLDLPPGFKGEEFSKYPYAGKGWQSGSQKMISAINTDANKATIALLQLHADQGMNGARTMVETGIANREAYFQTHPDIAKRYASDPAYKAGFDALIWARANGADAYRELTNGLDARDIRYEQHNIAYRA